MSTDWGSHQFFTVFLSWKIMLKVIVYNLKISVFRINNNKRRFVKIEKSIYFLIKLRYNLCVI